MMVLNDGIIFLLSALALAGTFYLLILTLFAIRRPSPMLGSPMEGRIAIIVPAHNEAAGLARTVNNLLTLTTKDSRSEVIVVADNCTDHTVELAESYGVRVLVREDNTRRGKGYALDYAFRTLESECFAAYVVIDADSVASPSLLPVLRQYFAAGTLAVQCRYGALQQHIQPSISALALLAFNTLRPRGRHNLGLSVGILGNGFALRRELLQKIPYTATSVVEDLEYHLRLVEAGVRVRFADAAAVYGEMPDTYQAAKSQRARWEGGRLRILIEHGGSMVCSIFRGHWRLIEPLFDLLMLPLAWHVILLVLLAAMPDASAATFGILGLMVLFFHVQVAAHIGGLSWRSLLAVLSRVPVYLMWKLSVIPAILINSRKDSLWIRTSRNKKRGDGS